MEELTDMGALKATAADVGKNFGQFADKALVEPVTITKYGREHLVLLSAEEYRRLKQRDRRAWATSEAPAEIVQAVADAKMDDRHAHLDDLVKDWQE
jgi:prevent-host-death family protein